MQKTVSLTVNGKPVSATVEGRTLLVQLLREQLGLTGTHVGCDTSQCGACVVHVDGEAVKACTLLAVQAEGRSVLTIEAVADGGATLLHYTVQAHVGGKLAQIGSRLIDSVARKMAENFFTRFVAAVASEQPAEASETVPGAAAAGPEVAATETAVKPKDVRLPPVLWVTGLAAVIGGILYYFTGRRVTR